MSATTTIVLGAPWAGRPTCAPAAPSVPMRDLDEAVLIRRCREGREDAYRELVERYQRRVLWVAQSMVGNEQAAEDIAQEAFIRVFRNIRRFDLSRNFYTWLYQIVTNLCIDHLRRYGRKRAADLDAIGPLADGRPSPAERSGREELRARVQAVLDRLPAKYRLVLALRDLQGFSCQEIAEIVGCNHATARWRLHRARQLFKALWNGEPVSVEEEGDPNYLRGEER
jgi:RNA polymerase sigma-70 factor (ECF subfamily)